MKRLFTISSLILIYMIFLQSQSTAQDTISPPNPGGVTKVYIGLTVNNIVKVDAVNQYITADIFISARWNDPRLVHNSENSIIISPEKVWDPFITISNRLNVSKSFPESYTVMKDGTVLYFQRLYGDFSQRFLLHNFPFDKQSFNIRIIDITLNPDEVLLEPDTLIKSDLSNDLALSDWEFNSWSFEKSIDKLRKDGPERSTLLFTINASRDSGYYLLIFVIPLVLIIMMSLLAFWLPANLSASRIAVGTTSMLTLIAYRFIVASGLPKISYMTRLDIFILGSSILIFLTLLESVMTSSMANKGKIELAQKIEFNSRWIFPALYVIVALFALIF